MPTPFNRQQCLALLQTCGWPLRELSTWPDWQLQYAVRNRLTTGEISEDTMNRVINDLHEASACQ